MFQIVVDDGHNDPEVSDHSSIDECVEYILTKIVQLHKDENDEWIPWVEEKDGKLWNHWGSTSYSVYDTVFDEGQNVSDNIPKTIQELREYIAINRHILFFWSSRAQIGVTINEVRLNHILG